MLKASDKIESYSKWSMLLMFFLVTACSPNKDNRLETGFRTPPDSVKLGTYWYWINGNISKEGVTKDLEAMAKWGIGKAFIGIIGLKTVPNFSDNPVKLFSTEWWTILKQVFKVADSLGIKIGMFNGPGWSQSGGPWVKPSESMRYLTQTTFYVDGPKILHKQLQPPDKHFQRTAVLAFPTQRFIGRKRHLPIPHITSNWPLKNRTNLIDGDTATACIFPKLAAEESALNITLKWDKPITARSLLLYPAHIPFKARVQLQVKKGNSYHTIKTFQFNRTNAGKNVGFMPYSPVVVAFPRVRAKTFRLVFTSRSASGGLSEIKLTPRSYVERYVEKQLGKMYQMPLPMWSAYLWPDQRTSYKSSLLINPDSVLNITSYVTSNGILKWKVPAGQWTIMQMGMLPTGVTNAPAPPYATGLEIDKMNKQNLKDHFKAFIGRILSRISAEDRVAFKYVIADSYETGPQTWTDGFAKAFEKEYGYDPLPWLPVLSGRIVGSADQSNRFLWDMRRLIADRIAYQYVGGLSELSHQHGLKLWLENYGHWGFSAEFLQYGGQADLVSGEFWAEGSLGSIELKAASSAAHIYGKNKVFAESFTAAGKPFQRYPGYLKKRADWAFTQGVNATILHVYISQSHDNPKPGINAWFGTEFNRKNTWFKMAKPFFTYLRRCNFMLQQGWSAKDVAYYIGESTPKMTGILEPELPDGYSFDWMNAEVIKNRLSVDSHGNLVLPNGISYELLVLPPQKTMRPAVLKQIMQLVKAGATILGPRPKRSPSLENYLQADRKVKKLASKLWQDIDSKTVKKASYGEGMVLYGMNMKEAFDLLHVVPDFQVDFDKPVLYTHRRTPEADIYFVSNQSDSTIHMTPSFRVLGRQPEWWNPVTGTTRSLSRFIQHDKSTIVPLTLGPYQSGFVVFREEVTTEEGSGINFPDARLVTKIKGPWKVTFNSDSIHRGPSHPVIFDQLIEWSNSSKDSIKYYSGTAIYQTTFNVNNLAKDATIYLNLGKVKVIAEVRLNGQKVESVWIPPWRVNVTSAIKKGKNTLTVKVVNTWVNRLIGDSRLSLAKKETHTVVNPYTPESPLQPSGLLGPVTIRTVRY